jgi:hypothetical protein
MRKEAMTLPDIYEQINVKVKEKPLRITTTDIAYNVSISLFLSALPLLHRLFHTCTECTFDLTALNMHTFYITALGGAESRYRIVTSSRSQLNINSLTLLFLLLPHTYSPFFRATSIISLITICSLSYSLFTRLLIAEHNFAERLRAAKYFACLTSSRKAYRHELPHFRLHKGTDNSCVSSLLHSQSI